MKNLNRYLSIFALVVVSGTPLLNKPVTATEAALSAPASYDFNFQYNSSTSRFTFGTSSLGTSVPYFTRTSDGIYYDYISVLNDEQNSGGLLPDGLEVTMDFQRSNTTWASIGGLGVSFYSTDTKIGSDNTVGTVIKFIYSFDNQTNKDYQLYLDVSSSGGYSIEYLWNVESLGTGTYTLVNSSLQRFIIPSFTKIQLKSTSTAATRYFDAWYLKDLGESLAYDTGYGEGVDDGYDLGYEDGYNNSASPIWDGAELVIGVVINFVLFVMTLSVFDISLLNIAVILIGVLGLVWVLKALRG